MNKDIRFRKKFISKNGARAGVYYHYSNSEEYVDIYENNKSKELGKLFPNKEVFRSLNGLDTVRIFKNEEYYLEALKLAKEARENSKKKIRERFVSCGYSILMADEVIEENIEDIEQSHACSPFEEKFAFMWKLDNVDDVAR